MSIRIGNNIIASTGSVAGHNKDTSAHPDIRQLIDTKQDKGDYSTRQEVDSKVNAAKSELQTKINAKQDTLVSATNIKTINGQSILGPGNIFIQGGGEGGVESVNGKDGVVVLTGEDLVATVDEQEDTLQGHLQTLANKDESLEAQISTKQNTLIPGDNITIEGNVISATGGSSTEITYNDEREQLVINTGETPVEPELDFNNLDVGDRLNNIASFATYFTDANNEKYAVFVLDAQYRTAGKEMPILAWNWQKYGIDEVINAKESSTFNTNLVFDNFSVSSSFFQPYWYARNPNNQSLIIYINGVPYSPQLPNGYELKQIYNNRVVLDANDPTLSSFYEMNLTSWNFTSDSHNLAWTSNHYTSFNDFILLENNGSFTWATNWGGAVIPVLEIPVNQPKPDYPDVKTIKLDGKVLEIKGEADNAYTRDNLIAGDNVTITEVAKEGGIDEHTLSCFHFDGNHDDSVQNSEYSIYGHDGHEAYDEVNPKFGSAAFARTDAGWTRYINAKTGIYSEYTIDFWAKRGRGGFSWLIESFPVNINGYKLKIFNTDNSEILRIGGTDIITCNKVCGDGLWHHHAIVLTKTYIEYFIDGESQGKYEKQESNISVGGEGYLGNAVYDEFRFSDIARYTSNFTPKDSEYTDSSQEPTRYQINSTQDALDIKLLEGAII